MKKIRTKCAICNHRYVERKEWKTKEENETCFTCYSTKQAILLSMQALVGYARAKGIKLEYNFTLEPIKVWK